MRLWTPKPTRPGHHQLSAAEAAQQIRDGSMTSEALVEACLARIREVDPDVQAWTFLDPAHALAQARAADARRASGRPLGALHGVPVGLKDIIDTADMPTENGSPLHAGRMPSRDAAVVAMLRGAGAIIMGKTVTTEFAVRTPGKTRNPHDPAHTPGGSSSGSAAAVAAEMVPLSLGSQTGGSTIRPGAYCGIFALKPTHGRIPRTGMWQLSRSLDHVGLFARGIDDVALLLEELDGHDPGDPDTRPRPRVPYRAIAAGKPPAEPRLAFVRTELWDRVDADMREGITDLAKALGSRAEEVAAPDAVREAVDWHKVTMEAEMARGFEREWATGREGLSPALRERIESGLAARAVDYLRARARLPGLVASFDELFGRGYDAILTPPAFGTAPKGLDSTGDPALCSLWTLTGMPSVSVPLLQGANGLPLGVQLVGPRDGDGPLLRTARWLVERIRG